MGVGQLPAWYPARDMPDRTESGFVEAFGIAVKRGSAGGNHCTKEGSADGRDNQ